MTSDGARMLEFDSVRKAYGNHVILEIPSLAIEPGVFWLQGSNGAGKSTVLKMIAGMIPFEGEITLDEVALHRSPVPYRRLVNYVEAEPLYPPFLTGRDLIEFHRRTRKADKNQASQLEEAFGVASFAANQINTYSSGMLKKLSLVLAFIGQPRLILLDEPLVTIDKDTIPILYSIIKDRHKNDTSFIIASHQALDPDLLPDTKTLSIADQQLCRK